MRKCMYLLTRKFATQVSMNAPVQINVGNESDPLRIAMKELKEGKIVAIGMPMVQQPDGPYVAFVDGRSLYATHLDDDGKKVPEWSEESSDVAFHFAPRGGLMSLSLQFSLFLFSPFPFPFLFSWPFSFSFTFAGSPVCCKTLRC